MSIVFSVLLLLFLGFSFHAFGNRTLGVEVVDDHHSISKEYSDVKLNPGSRVSNKPNSMPNDATRDDNANVKQGDEDTVDSESVARVRWRVPHRRKGEREAGFNLDYLPPKTHPPIHN